MDPLIAGYGRFHRSRWLSERERYRETVEHGQHPSALVLACCDSRVDPQMIFDARPGELFTVRNIANLAPPHRPDLAWQETSAAIEFAVRVLEVPEIVVLGHGMCGGVRALLEGPVEPPTPFVAHWVDLAREAVCVCAARHVGEARFKAGEQEMVRLSLRNLQTFPWIVDAVREGRLRLRGAYFDIRSGDLELLQPDGSFAAGVSRPAPAQDHGARSPLSSASVGEGEQARDLWVRPLRDLPLFGAGDDLCAALVAALREQEDDLRDGDVIVVAQKVVSKCEGRAVRVADVHPDPLATRLAEATGKDPRACALILQESRDIVREGPNLVIARHHSGQVLANAGIDASNVDAGEEDQLLLWPVDPDASARRLRAALEAAFGVRLAVIISDSLGRAWRVGTTGHAIGVAGLSPLRDRRGETDLFGRPLQATVIGVADEIAAAASLVIGEAAEGVPAARVRGATYVVSEAGKAVEVVRPPEMDLFP